MNNVNNDLFMENREVICNKCGNRIGSLYAYCPYCGGKIGGRKMKSKNRDKKSSSSSSSIFLPIIWAVLMILGVITNNFFIALPMFIVTIILLIM